MSDTELEPRTAVLAVEAALFSAGRPVDVASLADTTGYGRKQVRDALEHLQDAYRERETAIEVEPAGEKWTMQVRTAYAEGVRTLAPMEVPEKTLKTLALIAYHQPILQSDLQDMIGSKVYDHVGELKDLGLVRKRKHDRSYLLSTTEKFPEYFGLDTTDPGEIRRQLAEKVGIPLPQDDGRGNRTLGSYDAGAREPEGVEGEGAASYEGGAREPEGVEGEGAASYEGGAREPEGVEGEGAASKGEDAEEDDPPAAEGPEPAPEAA